MRILGRYEKQYVHNMNIPIIILCQTIQLTISTLNKSTSALIKVYHTGR